MGALEYTVWVKSEGSDIIDTSFGPDSAEIPDWALEQIGAHAFEGGEKPEPQAAVPYAKRKKADLEAEVAKRNEGRDDDDLVVVEGTGKVADLAAALEADDAKTAAAS